MIRTTLLLPLMAALLPAAQDQPFTTTVPRSVRQGDTIRIDVRDAGERLQGGSVSFAGKRVPLFAQSPGVYLGLMPVAVRQEPGRHPLDIRDAGGAVVATVPVEVRDARFPRQNIEVTQSMKKLEPLPGELETVRAFLRMVSDKRFWREPFRSPALGCMNSPFGVLRYHNGVFTGEYHRGVDLRAPAGRPVRAISAGVVKVARKFRFLGGTVGLDHGQGLVSMYLHMSRIQVREGRMVRKGDVVGLVGATGFATGPHLHWALYVNGTPVNPTQWVRTAPCAARDREGRAVSAPR